MKRSSRILLTALLYLSFGLSTHFARESNASSVGAGSASDSKPGDAAADPGLDWMLTRDDEGIRSYQSRREGSPLLWFKGEGVIDAPIPLVVSVVLDAERAGEWISYLSESVVLRWIEEPVEYVQFTRFDAPWPVKDRTFISRVVLEVEPESYAASLTYHSSELRVDSQNAILGSVAGSHYLLRPIDGGARTHFTGIGVADPKGSLPSWLVNWVGGSWPHETIQALRRQVRKQDVFVMPLLQPLYAGFEVEPRLQLISAESPASK